MLRSLLGGLIAPGPLGALIPGRRPLAAWLSRLLREAFRQPLWPRGLLEIAVSPSPPGHGWAQAGQIGPLS
jgi:hypothetical protein